MKRPSSRATSGQVFRPRRHSAGAALLAALITVALVAVFAGQSFWQQWRGIEIETAERNRLQASWLLGGTLDWARARLREDGLRSPLVDHAAEAWAQPVADQPLAEFLAGASAESARVATPSVPNQAWPPPAVPAAASGLAGGSSPAFDAQVSLQVQDAQGKLNVLNLLDGQALSTTWLRAFDQLFVLLNLPPEQLATLAANLRGANAALTASGNDNTAAVAAAALLPQQTAQLVWLGLEPATLAALSAHVTLLPTRTPVNLNSASPEVLQALVPSLTRLDAQRLVALRQMKPWLSVADAGLGGALGEGQFSVNSRFFELRMGLRLGPATLLENALLQRDGADVRTLWRRRSSSASPRFWPTEASPAGAASAGVGAASLAPASRP